MVAPAAKGSLIGICLIVAFIAFTESKARQERGRVRYEAYRTFSQYWTDEEKKKAGSFEFADFIPDGESASCTSEQGQEYFILKTDPGAKASFCMDLDNRAATLEVVRRKYPDEYRDLSDDSIYAKLVEKQPARGYQCITHDLPCGLDTIVLKRQVQGPLRAGDYASIAGATTGFPLGLFAVATLIYNRVFLYIIFGSRKKLDAAAV